VDISQYFHAVYHASISHTFAASIIFPCLATDLSHTVHDMNHQKRGNSEENLWEKCGKLLQML
jgi:predicted HD phosphohydrolase